MDGALRLAALEAGERPAPMTDEEEEDGVPQRCSIPSSGVVVISMISKGNSADHEDTPQLGGYVANGLICTCIDVLMIGRRQYTEKGSGKGMSSRAVADPLCT